MQATFTNSELPRGLDMLEVVRENQRFATYRARYESKPVFVKQIRNGDLKDALLNELWGLQTFQQLNQLHRFPFAVPEIILSGSDYIVTNWVEGEPMELKPEADDYLDNLRFLANSFASIDRVSRFVNVARAEFGLPGQKEQTTGERLSALLGKVEYRQFFDKGLIARATGYVDDNLPKLEARLTHADFTPNNVLVQGAIKTVVDYESTSFLWPRFYDLVNFTYNRIIMEPHLIDGMKQTINQTFEILQQQLEESILQLNTIAMARALSMIYELMTEPNSYHNTQLSINSSIADRLASGMGNILEGQFYAK